MNMMVVYQSQPYNSTFIIKLKPQIQQNHLIKSTTKRSITEIKQMFIAVLGPVNDKAMQGIKTNFKFKFQNQLSHTLLEGCVNRRKVTK